MTPSTYIFRVMVGLILNAANKVLGMGNVPALACLLASINPTVAAGNTIKANAPPITGTMEMMDTTARNMKNKPPKANGCLKNV